jgi:hypothetical protein
VIRKKGDKKSGTLASYKTWYVLNITELKDEKGQKVTVLKNQKY